MSEFVEIGEVRHPPASRNMKIRAPECGPRKESNTSLRLGWKDSSSSRQRQESARSSLALGPLALLIIVQLLLPAQEPALSDVSP